MKPEGGPGTRVALQADLTTLALDELLAQVEAESQPSGRPTVGIRALASAELFPDLRLFFRGNARSMVAHLQARLACLDAEDDCDGAFRRRIFEGVRQIIGEHLPDALCIGAHHGLPSLGHLQVDYPFWQGGVLYLHRIPDHRRQIAATHGKRKLPPLEL